MNARRLVTAIVFLAIFAMAARVSVDNDTWWHLRAGQWMVENGKILQVDLFSYTRYGQPWQYPGWLVEVPMYLIYRWLGPGGLNLWTAAMVTLAFAFVWASMQGGVFLKAFLLVLSAAASGVYWAARPYLVTFVLAAAFLWILETDRSSTANRQRRLVWLLPILMAVWANSHGGFAAGFLIWGAYLAERLASWAVNRLRARQGILPGPRAGENAAGIGRLLVIGALMVVGACLNPSGVQMLLYPFRTVQIAALQAYIQEWQPPDFHALEVQPFLWLLLLVIGAAGASRRRMPLSDFLLAAGFAYMGFMSARNIALFALAAPLVIARQAAPLINGLTRRFGFQLQLDAQPTRLQAGMNGLILAVLAAAVMVKAALVFPEPVNQQAIGKSLPSQAVDYLASNPIEGRLFSTYNWGGYLIWRLPGEAVFVDGRTDLYNDAVINQWLRVVRAEPGWQATLDQWEIQAALLEPDMPVVARLRTAGWEQVYADQQAVILTR